MHNCCTCVDIRYNVSVVRTYSIRLLNVLSLCFRGPDVRQSATGSSVERVACGTTGNTCCESVTAHASRLDRASGSGVSQRAAMELRNDGYVQWRSGEGDGSASASTRLRLGDEGTSAAVSAPELRLRTHTTRQMSAARASRSMLHRRQCPIVICTRASSRSRRED